MLAAILGDGVDESGGRYVTVLGSMASVPQQMQRIADELLNQHELTYTPPVGTGPGATLFVSSVRACVVVRAPTRVAP